MGKKLETGSNFEENVLTHILLQPIDNNKKKLKSKAD